MKIHSKNNMSLKIIWELTLETVKQDVRIRTAKFSSENFQQAEHIFEMHFMLQEKQIIIIRQGNNILQSMQENHLPRLI